MSNLPSSPGSRPLEQLKVAELRDELKKRGMSIKGVKKELFERLEEAIKQEEQEGVVHVEHGAAQEEAHETGTLGETDDLEGQYDTLDGTKDDASKSHDTMDVCQSDTSLVPINNESTPLPETQMGVCQSDTSPVPINNESTPLPETQMDVCQSDTSPVPINNESTPLPETQMDVCQSDTSPIPNNGESPIPNNDESAPISDTQAMSGVSAPDGVPGFSEDREPNSAAGVANVKTNNDVLFVDNAVCGNGDAMVLPENVPAGVADVLEPGKEASGLGDTASNMGNVQSGNDENGPILTSDSLISDPTVIQIDGSAPLSSFGSGASENKVSADELNLPTENGDPRVAVDNVMSENDASANNCRMDDVETEVVNCSSESEIMPLSQTPGFFDKSQEVIQVNVLKTESLSISSCLPQSVFSQNVNKPLRDLKSQDLEASRSVDKPSTEMKSEELEGPIVDERDLVTNEERFNVGERDKIINEEKFDVKMEPMERDTDPEANHEVIREGRKELQIEKEVPFQSKSPSEEAQLMEVESEKPRHDDLRERGGERSASRVPDDSTKDVVDVPVEDDSRAHVNLKRKDDDIKLQEPAKRMRRWNSGSQVAVEALKPLKTDTVREIVLPESTEDSSLAAEKLTPRAMANSRSLPPNVKAESESSGSPRSVPPSTRAPSDSLKIERFVRPFTLKAVKDLLAEFGQCVDFWMDQIKTHCFVTYSSVNEASAARTGLYGRQWPPSVGNFLTAEFVDASEVKTRTEGLSEKAQAAPATASLRATNAPPPRLAQSAPPFRSGLNTLPPSRFSREGQLPPAPKKDPEPIVLTLEDLFCKTKAKPHIYYLPLTDEQVAERIKKKQAPTR